jgi:hypothetical protein
MAAPYRAAGMRRSNDVTWRFRRRCRQREAGIYSDTAIESPVIKILIEPREVCGEGYQRAVVMDSLKTIEVATELVISATIAGSSILFRSDSQGESIAFE